MTREEAIKIIKEFVNDTCLHLVDQEALETLIPELKESDDERIRKWIKKEIEYKYVVEGIVNSKQADEALGWLEKQKHLYETTKDRFYREGFEEGQLYEKQKDQEPIKWDEYTKINLDRALQIIKKAKGTLQGYQSDDGIYECDKAIECLEHFLYRGLEIEKHTECIEFDNEFDNQVSHILASVLNGEHEYNKDFIKYAAQSLLGYAKNELKSDELNEREKLMKALQTSNAQIGELVEENYKLKEQRPVEINEYEIIKKHITDDSLSSEVNKRLKECGWYVTDEKPAEWNKDCNEEDIQTRFAFYTYKDDPCTLYLSNVFVEETSRNKGFGTKILTAAEKVAETLGVTYIRLKVKQDSPANAWYHKNGYGYVAFEDGYNWLEKNLEYMKPNKQEWDEFDEDCLKRAVWYIENPTPSVVKDTNLALWLKSIPGRFDLQPKQEWSDEDETAFDDLMWCIKQAEKSAKDENDMGNIWFAENWVKNKLKSLRPQPKAELTLLDKNIIKAAIAFVEQNNHFNCWGGIDKRTVIKALRSLKPNWKPSEEQIKWLKDVIETVPMTCRQQVLLESLYNDLLKLT